VPHRQDEPRGSLSFASDRDFAPRSSERHAGLTPRRHPPMPLASVAGTPHAVCTTGTPSIRSISRISISRACSRAATCFKERAVYSRIIFCLIATFRSYMKVCSKKGGNAVIYSVRLSVSVTRAADPSRNWHRCLPVTGMRSAEGPNGLGFLHSSNSANPEFAA
jgi:hypothetical protein